jgi:hypothetical protein
LNGKLGFVDDQHPNDVLNWIADEGPGVLGLHELMEADEAICRFTATKTKAVGLTHFDVPIVPPKRGPIARRLTMVRAIK